MRKTESKNLSEFIRAIDADADRACENIKNESLKEKREKLNAAAKRFECDSSEKIDRAEKDLKSESNREITALENEMRDELIQRRNSIRQNVFSKVETKLRSFVKTQEYRDFLLESAAKIGSVVKGENIIIFARSEDADCFDEIKRAVGRQCEIQTDDTIALGGLKASTDIQTADDTLDSRLENEKEWFVNNSDLKIV